MAFSASDVDALETAIKSGQLKVRFADREVTYHSLEALIAARNTILREVNAGGSNPHAQPRHQLASFVDD